MKGVFWLLLGGALGALLSYFFDAARRMQRRSMMQDRLREAGNQLQEQADSARRDMIEPRLREWRDARERAMEHAAAGMDAGRSA